MADLPLPPPTRYDQVARYLVHQTERTFFTWTLGLNAAQVGFTRWRELVLAREHPQERGDCALALVFADHRGRRKIWEDAMSDITFIEAPIIGELLEKAEARAEARGEARGRTEGEILGKRGNLLRLMERRRWVVPTEVTLAIQSSTDAGQLDTWFDAAVDAASLELFRQLTGL